MSWISLFNAIWNRSSDLVSWLAQQGRNHETIYFCAFCGFCQLRKISREKEIDVILKRLFQIRVLDQKFHNLSQFGSNYVRKSELILKIEKARPIKRAQVKLLPIMDATGHTDGQNNKCHALLAVISVMLPLLDSKVVCPQANWNWSRECLLITISFMKSCLKHQRKLSHTHPKMIMLVSWL